MKIESSAFENGAMIPEIYTQESSEDISPPLTFSGVPKEAVSLTLLCIDPDVPDPAHPVRDFTHWIVVNLPPTTKGLPSNVDISTIPGAMAGINGAGTIGYIGPRPPIGTHRYFFKLFALDTKLPFIEPPTKVEVMEAMDGHVITEAETMGRYALKINR
ncbi:MAG: YbhB/YbcL family Raf kinase inhibitor-like protein [Burkholderiales bacterium]|nr:YbhB/YbcL family Raf kinase inhibitor-like protein [Burkholderiales bacterium]